MTAQEKFKIGDTVRLISGGPLMTVADYEHGADQLVKCTWFDKNKLCGDYFNIEIIESDDDDIIVM